MSEKKPRLIIDKETRYLCPHVGETCPFAKEIIEDGMLEILYRKGEEEVIRRLKKMIKKLEKT